jgi:hypothetical protein
MARPREDAKHLARARAVFPYIVQGLSMPEALRGLQAQGVAVDGDVSTYQRSFDKCANQVIAECLDLSIDGGLTEKQRLYLNELLIKIHRNNSC